MIQRLLPYRPRLLTALSGLLIVASFPPWDQSYLIWIAPIPWFLALNRTKSSRDALKEGIWLSVFMTIGGFSWVTYALQRFGGVPLPVAVVLMLLFAVVGQPQFPAYALARRAFLARVPEKALGKARPLLLAVALGILYCGIDAYSPRVFLDTMGHSQYNVPWTRQLAELGGAQLLTLLIWTIAEALTPAASALLARRRPALPEGLPAACAAALLALTLVWGRARYQEIATIETKAPIARFAAIQANIGDFEKVASESGLFEAGVQVLRKYTDLSMESLKADPKPEAVVWPETAYPSCFRKPMNSFEAARDRKLEEYVQASGVPLLFGGYDTDGRHDFNSLFFLEAKPEKPGQDLRIYHKSVLLPFGEYIPLTEHISFVREMFPQVGYFGRGPGPIIYPLKTRNFPALRITPIVCYEVLFPWFGIEAARKGSQLLLNVTNDSWFGPFGEPHLHLSLTTFRSIETRVPQLRATNTGVSALILPSGDMKGTTPLFEPRILQADVPVLDGFPPTLIVRWGDWVGLTCAALCLTGLAVYFLDRARVRGRRTGRR